MLEHVGALVAIGVLFTALIATVCWVGISRLRDQARKEARTLAASTIEHEVRERTAELEATANRYRIFVENTDAIAFEYDLTAHQFVYLAPQVARLLGSSSKRTRREFLGTLIHPDDRARVAEALASYAASAPEQRVAIQYRLVRDDGRILHVRTLLSNHTGNGIIRGIAIDVTQQTKLETEVRQAQKLESVGRLAAGVAHEINTPVQYVQDSVQFVREAMSDLFGVIEHHRAVTEAVLANAPAQELAARAVAADESADLAYLVENMPPALDRATDGLGRVTTIVHSLKAFAHPDQRQRSAVDINAALSNTLEMTRAEYKYVADVELDLEYELPRVECFGGEINQVLLNLIVNAAHAIEDAAAEERGLIRVCTRHHDGFVEISIGDTGCGISEGVRERIFEPFFTTKRVGRGTGQGLSIARSVIVEKHGGALSFDSTVGIGTTFTILLPVVAAHSSLGVAA